MSKLPFAQNELTGKLKKSFNSSTEVDTSDNNSTTSTFKVNDQLSFMGRLHASAQKNAELTFATWYNSKGEATNSYTYRKIWEEAGYIAHFLRVEHNCTKGDCVVLCYSPGLQFFAAFLGCLRAGIVAVPIYPPDPSNMKKGLDIIMNVSRDSDARIILVDSSVDKFLTLHKIKSAFSSGSKKLEMQAAFCVHPKTPKTMLGHSYDDASITESDLAFLQYTSGSTGQPKGAMITYGALNNNTHDILCDREENSFKRNHLTRIKMFSWLPQYHDMGLVYCIIMPFLGGMELSMMSPLDFMRDPLLWIELMSRHKCHGALVPNFAYRLTAKKFIQMKKKNPEFGRDLDLSHIIELGCAAEPIQVDTKCLLEDTFVGYGLHKDFFAPGYGLAESVSAVTVLHEFKLSASKNLVAVAKRGAFLGSSSKQVIKIVDPETKQELADGKVGEVWVSSQSVAKGYYKKPELTAETFQAKIVSASSHDDLDSLSYLRTGDLGFFEDDYLYICGRQKDIIIVNGHNYYPQDIEFELQNASAGVRPGCVAAFARDEENASGELEIVFEIRKSHEHAVDKVMNAVQLAVMKNVGLNPARVVAIEERRICKTTSGKIQRKENRRTLHSGGFNCCIIFDSGITSGHDASNPNRETDMEHVKMTFDEVISSFFGIGFDPFATWWDLGMSSIVSVQLRDAISDSFAIQLDPDCFDDFSTPLTLKKYVCDNLGKPLKANLREPLQQANSQTLSWWTLGWLQGLGSISILFLIVLNAMPSLYLLEFLNQDASRATWLRLCLVPTVVPLWGLSFSMTVIIMKWMVIWRYKEGIFAVRSVSFLRWWFLDRLVHAWECLFGKFVKGTHLLNLFYWAMGARISKNATIDAFIREYDLVEISEHSSLEHPLNCRKFSSWDASTDPLVRFRPIVIGQNCSIKGMVSLGASVGDGVVVNKLAVLPEGADVPPGTDVKGNPGFATLRQVHHSGDSVNWRLLALLKILFLFCQLYMSCGVAAIGHLWLSLMPEWRYTILFYWVLLLLWISLISLVISIGMKWIFIGKRKPGGPFQHTAWRKAVDWAADWQFVIPLGSLSSLLYNSRLWNIVLMMHGADLDFSTQLNTPEILPPSQVDLVRIRESFISIATFETTKNGSYQPISINQTSVGHGVQLGASVENSKIIPYTRVTKSMAQSVRNDEVLPTFSTFLILKHEALMFVCYFISFALRYIPLIPAYELWRGVFNSPTSLWVRVPALMCAISLHTVASFIILAAVQTIALTCRPVTRSKPWSRCMFLFNLNFTYVVQEYSFVMLIYGSSAYNFLVSCLGTKFKGRALLLPVKLFEFPYIEIADKTVVDGALIHGHYVVFDEITLGQSKVAGILHEGTWVGANATINSDESGPWRCFLGAESRPAPQFVAEEMA